MHYIWLTWFCAAGTFPIDTTKTRLQIQGQKIDARHSQVKYNGMIHALYRIFREEGPSALYSGYVVLLAKGFGLLYLEIRSLSVSLRLFVLTVAMIRPPCPKRKGHYLLDLNISKTKEKESPHNAFKRHGRRIFRSSQTVWSYLAIIGYGCGPRSPRQHLLEICNCLIYIELLIRVWGIFYLR